jgi:hypothetical protein
LEYSDQVGKEESSRGDRSRISIRGLSPSEVASRAGLLGDDPRDEADFQQALGDAMHVEPDGGLALISALAQSDSVRGRRMAAANIVQVATTGTGQVEAGDRVERLGMTWASLLCDRDLITSEEARESLGDLLSQASIGRNVLKDLVLTIVDEAIARASASGD